MYYLRDGVIVYFTVVVVRVVYNIVVLEFEVRGWCGRRGWMCCWRCVYAGRE